MSFVVLELIILGVLRLSLLCDMTGRCLGQVIC